MKIKNIIQNLTFVSILSKSFRVIVGPVTLVLIASSLTSEELGFYYTFFSIIAMRQLLEVGVNSVLKQFYAHEFDNVLISNNYDKVSSLFIFSMYWYFFVAILFALLSSATAYFIFSRADSVVEWQGSWTLLMITSTFLLFQLPFKSYLDGMQEQIKMQSLTLISDIVGVLFLWAFLISDFGLYSLGLSQVAINIIFYLLLFFLNGDKFRQNISCEKFDFKSIFFEVWPLLKKTGIVFFLGYFYWNGFNIISFDYLGPALAGMIGLSIAMSRAGQNIALAGVLSHSTQYARLISNEKDIDAYSGFKVQFLGGFLLLISGYLLYCACYLINPNFSFFSKALPIDEMTWVFLFFILSFIISSLDNYTRCYKVELFVKVQAFNSVFTPLLFFMGMKLSLPYFLLPCVSLFLVLVTTYFKFSRLLRNYNHD
ncbi:O81 family O-antigen flippase [Vibrio splendidus]|uniref:O81 family O-antigen flippase n=1 Tax=Vibrio splendidus TaxID=29497 RepID=UPI0012FD515F|nr:O81 family O-antigen flippase [Vibrio splendidus]